MMTEASVERRDEPAALPPCRNPRNCASDSMRRGEEALRPIAFHAPSSQVMIVIRCALAELPRTRVVVERTWYLRAESTSRLFRFVDDVEVLADEATGLIHFRSASRIGRRDFGVNRRRLIQLARLIRRRLAEPMS